MKNFILILSFFVLLSFAGKAANAWEINFQFNVDDIKNRNVGKVLTGAVASVAVHEAGHFLVGRAIGMDTKFIWKNGPAVWVDDFEYRSETDQAIFAVAGMLSQSIVGTVLTYCDNDSDYTLGFNSMSAVSNLTYPLRDKETSDWKHMPGGKAIAIGNGLYSTGLTLINLDIISATE